MIAYLPESCPPLLGFEVSGKITLDHERDMIDYVDKMLLEHDKLSFLIILTPDARWGVEAGIEDLKWLVTHLKRIRKIALVSDSNVLKWLMLIDRPFTKLMGLDEEHFTMSQLDEAWAWIKAD